MQLDLNLIEIFSVYKGKIVFLIEINNIYNVFISLTPQKLLVSVNISHCLLHIFLLCNCYHNDIIP